MWLSTVCLLAIPGSKTRFFKSTRDKICSQCCRLPSFLGRNHCVFPISCEQNCCLVMLQSRLLSDKIVAFPLSVNITDIIISFFIPFSWKSSQITCKARSSKELSYDGLQANTLALGRKTCKKCTSSRESARRLTFASDTNPRRRDGKADEET